MLSLSPVSMASTQHPCARQLDDRAVESHPQPALGPFRLSNLNDLRIDVFGASPQQSGCHHRPQREPRVDQEHHLEAVGSMTCRASLVVPRHCLRVQRPCQVCRLDIAACRDKEILWSQ